jgi:transposase-like protein
MNDEQLSERGEQVAALHALIPEKDDSVVSDTTMTYAKLSRPERQGTGMTRFIRMLRNAKEAGNEQASAMHARLFDKKDLTITTFRGACIAAGIWSPPGKLEQLIKAWGKCSLEDRQEFLYMLTDGEDNEFNRTMDETETDSTIYKELIESIEARRKPRTFAYKPKKEAIPELERLIESGITIVDIAKQIGVSDRTLRRWRWGHAKPKPDAIEKIKAMNAAVAE